MVWGYTQIYMSYNLLSNTNFDKFNPKSWKLTNCQMVNSCLISNDKVFAIEQEIVIPYPAKLYFGINYMCFGEDVRCVYCGIQIGNSLEVNKKIPIPDKKKRISIVCENADKIKVMFICESDATHNRVYIDSPTLIDLNPIGKEYWPRSLLNNALDFRHGFEYENEFKYGGQMKPHNFTIDSFDIQLIDAPIGMLATIDADGYIELSNHKFIAGNTYLIKLDYKQLSNYGSVFMQYGSFTSTELGPNQLCIIFKANRKNKLKINVSNPESLSYMINFRHLLILNLKNIKVNEEEIPYLPFV